ncbi:MAG: hypothetical protein KF749_04235 [Bacteroidetes bacterium]|nr:hypothetical protein [Bacteroidota bacterium]MCW5897205.1 hypothetical protein [Bacteroidota bacterium]
MARPLLFWFISLIITLAAAYYQRTTGPTYPLSGKVVVDGLSVTYNLLRSHGGDGNALVSIPVPDESISGVLHWKRFKTKDEWTEVEMTRRANELVAELPHQPPAGKLEYKVHLTKGREQTQMPSSGTVVIRFKGDVPAGALIPHVIAMFAAMLFSNRAGIEIFNSKPNLKGLTIWTLGLMTVGGMILGPIVQKYAFGEYWTGIPFGTDLTDNKTLIAFVAWIVAAIALFKSNQPKTWVFAAAMITLIVFLIPHSLFGSELDYGELPE